MRPRFVPCTCAADDPIRDPRTVRLTYRTQAEALTCWAKYSDGFRCCNEGLHADAQCCHFHSGRRWWVICGPLGHIVGIDRT